MREVDYGDRKPLLKFISKEIKMTKYIDRYYLNWEMYAIKFAGGDTPKEYDIDITNFKTEQILSWEAALPGCGYTWVLSADWTRYVCRTSNTTIRKYILTTPYDFSAYDSYQEMNASGSWEVHQTYVSPDWTKLAYCWYYSNMWVRIVTLSTLRDLTTATNELYRWEGQVVWLWFKPDWTRMYCWYYNNNWIKQYDLSTPWDITTGTYAGQLATWRERGVTLSPDWKYLIKTDGNNSYPHTTIQYELSTPWDITTASQYKSISQSNYNMCALSLDWSRLVANGNYVWEFYELTA